MSVIEERTEEIRILDSMEREELEQAYLEALEDVQIYRRFYMIAKKILKSKIKKKYFIPRKWIEQLDVPTVMPEYTEPQFETVGELKYDLEELAFLLGFKNEVVDGFRDKRNRIGKREAKALLERLGISTNKEW